MLVQNLLRLYQPCEKDIDIYNKVERCIRWGYADRNPLSPKFIQQQQHEFEARNLGEGFVQYTQSYPTTSGFALLGISGLGKSTTLRHVLGRYPQVIRHKRYNGIPFNGTQITWIHMDCPEDGSLKGLCSGFFEHIDNLLGTDYFSQYGEKKATLNKMRIPAFRERYQPAAVSGSDALPCGRLQTNHFPGHQSSRTGGSRPHSHVKKCLTFAIPKPDLREMAVQALLAFGVDRPRAMNCVNRTLARFPGCSHSSVLAREAYSDFLQSQGKESSSSLPGKQVLVTGYAANLSGGHIGL